MAHQIYRNSSGQRLPSVTTVLSHVGDKGGLIRWAYNLGRDGSDMDQERVTSAMIGTLTHSMVEAVIRGTDPYAVRGPVAELEVARKCFLGFETWLDSTHLELVEAEVPLSSERHRFGGCLDMVLRDTAGALLLGDLKTSNQLYGTYLMQLGGYALLLEENQPGIELAGAQILRVSKKDGSVHHHAWPRETLELGQRAFLLALELYRLEATLNSAVGK